MTEPTIAALLAKHKLLGGAPAAEHEWLAAHGTRRRLGVGDVLTHKGELASALYILFSGYVVIRVDRGAGSHKIFERRGGEVSGMLPYSRGTRPPNDAVIEEPAELLAIPVEHHAEMIRECPVVTAALVHEMVDRVKQFNASDLHDEKLVSLGKLAAGLAHELNNPASAAVRSAKALEESFSEAEAAAAAIAAARLSDEQLAAIERVRQQRVPPTEAAVRSAIARADEEDALGERLEDLGATANWAVPLADAGLKPTALDSLAAVVGGDALEAALRWITAGYSVRTLAWEIETATSRIYDLVNTMKGFTYMDRAPMLEPVDVRRGLNETLALLAAKTRSKSAKVTLEFPNDLPRAHAVGPELNQVWINLIENALDAVAPGGRVTVTAGSELDRVVVCVTDDGVGIPPEIKGRIFDPFFTTKPVGEGTGLGLDIVRRILRRHEGEIDVDSSPGHTAFRVSLPVAR
ncbi:MAG TPA: ATP-binding protein [Gemmatimonadaceae bacterium]|jgi:signal transduction histidine kinase|nr:ATP-binding protein [Gemmatimonadaceae bacterium]